MAKKAQSTESKRKFCVPKLAKILTLKNLKIFLFIFETETEHEQGRGRERETQTPKQAPGSELSAQSPTWGSNSQTVRS